MKLDTDKVPSTHEQAVTMLLAALSDEERERMRDRACSVATLHHGLGRFLRNSWSLWVVETPLVRYYREHAGLMHADDLSSLILEDTLHRVRHGKTISAASFWSRVKECRDHWRAQGIDPATGKPLAH